jgi:hypothetical protein
LEQPVKLESDFWGTIILVGEPASSSKPGHFSGPTGVYWAEAGSDFYSAKNFISALTSGTTKQIVC